MGGMRYQPQGLCRINQAHPLARNLRLALNGASRGVQVHGPSVTRVGASASAAGKFGLYQSFNGSDQGLSVPLNLSNTQAVTVVAMIDLSSIGAAQQNLWEFGTDVIATYEGFNAYTGQYGLEAWTGSGSPARDGNTYANPPLGSHVIAAVYDHSKAAGAQVSFFVDGAQQARTAIGWQTGGPGPFSSATLYIGSRTNSQNWTNMRQAGFFLFDRALTSAEIAQFSANPWQLFVNPEEDDFVAAASGGGATSLAVTPAALSLSGGAVALRVSRTIAAQPAALSIAGGNVAMRAARRLVTAAAALAVQAGSVQLRALRGLAVAPAQMAINGGTVQFQHTPAPVVGSYAIAVSPASFSLAGGVVAMRANRRLAVAPAALTGGAGAIQIRAQRRIPVQAESFQVDGKTVSFGYSGGGSVDISKVSFDRITIFEASGSRVVIFESSGSRLEFELMSALPAYKVGDKWFNDRDPDEESYYAADITEELAARNTTAVQNQLVLVLTGVAQLAGPVIQTAVVNGEQRTFVVAFLGGVEGDPPPGWSWTARVRCANGERFDKTTHFNRKDG